MKSQLIILPEYPIIVSDEEISVDDWRIRVDSKNNYFVEQVTDNTYNYTSEKYFKIIAGIPDLPLIDFNGFERKFGIINYWAMGQKIAQKSKTSNKSAMRNGFVKGFKYCQSLNEKRFSLDDMRKLASAAFTIKSNNETLIEDFDKWFDNRIKSLSQPKVFHIDIEMEEYMTDGWIPSYNNPDNHNLEPSAEIDWRPKITNNQIKIIKIL